MKVAYKPLMYQVLQQQDLKSQIQGQDKTSKNKYTIQTSEEDQKRQEIRKNKGVMKGTFGKKQSQISQSGNNEGNSRFDHKIVNEYNKQVNSYQKQGIPNLNYLEAFKKQIEQTNQAGIMPSFTHLTTPAQNQGPPVPLSQSNFPTNLSYQNHQRSNNNVQQSHGTITTYSDDNEYDLCFVVEEVEFLTFKSVFIQHSPYLKNLVDNLQSNPSNQNQSQIRVLLPLWATAKGFRVLLDFVNTTQLIEDLKMKEDDLSHVQNVLWLADFFQILPLQKLCIEKHILPKLNYDKVLPFMGDAYSKLSQCQQQINETQDIISLQYLTQCEDLWFNFFTKCLEIAAYDFDKIIKLSNEEDLINMPEEISVQLIEKASKNLFVKLHSNQVHHSISSRIPSFTAGIFSEILIKHMIKLRKGTQAGSQEVFELLEIEKRQALVNYRKTHGISPLTNQLHSVEVGPDIITENEPKPLLTWKLADLNLMQNFYRESEIFHTQVTTSDFISWKLFIQKTNDKECIVGVKCLSPSEIQPKYINQIASLLSWVRIGSPRDGMPALENHYDLNFSHLVITPDNAQVNLRIIPLILIHQANSYQPSASSLNACLNIEVFFQLNYTVASVITYIRDQFGQLISGSSNQSFLSLLKVNELSLLLKDRMLSVKSEDQVIEALQMWLTSNINNTEEKVLIEEIIKQVNWPYVSFEKMLDLYRKFPKLKQNIHSKAIFTNQVKYRSTKLASQQLISGPRYSYDQVMIEAFFDYHYFLDKISDYLLNHSDSSNDISSLNQSMIAPSANKGSKNYNNQSSSYLHISPRIGPNQKSEAKHQSSGNKKPPLIQDNQLSSQKKKKKTFHNLPPPLILADESIGLDRQFGESIIKLRTYDSRGASSNIQASRTPKEQLKPFSNYQAENLLKQLQLQAAKPQSAANKRMRYSLGHVPNPLTTNQNGHGINNKHMLNLCAQNIALSQSHGLNKAQQNKLSTHSLALNQHKNSILSPSSKISEKKTSVLNANANGSVTPQSQQNKKINQLTSERMKGMKKLSQVESAQMKNNLEYSSSIKNYYNSNESFNQNRIQFQNNQGLISNFVQNKGIGQQQNEQKFKKDVGSYIQYEPLVQCQVEYKDDVQILDHQPYKAGKRNAIIVSSHQHLQKLNTQDPSPYHGPQQLLDDQTPIRNPHQNYSSIILQQEPTPTSSLKMIQINDLDDDPGVGHIIKDNIIDQAELQSTDSINDDGISQNLLERYTQQCTESLKGQQDKREQETKEHKINVSQRRFSAMKFLGDLNNSFLTKNQRQQ